MTTDAGWRTTETWKGIQPVESDTFHLAGPARQSQLWALCDPTVYLISADDFGPALFEFRVPPHLAGRVIPAAQVPERQRCSTCWHSVWPLN